MTTYLALCFSGVPLSGVLLNYSAAQEGLWQLCASPLQPPTPLPTHLVWQTLWCTAVCTNLANKQSTLRGKVYTGTTLSMQGHNDVSASMDFARSLHTNSCTHLLQRFTRRSLPKHTCGQWISLGASAAAHPIDLNPQHFHHRNPPAVAPVD